MFACTIGIIIDSVNRLRGFDGIGITEFEPGDVVRHPLVARIVRAYMSSSPHDEEESSRRRSEG